MVTTATPDGISAGSTRAVFRRAQRLGSHSSSLRKRYRPRRRSGNARGDEGGGFGAGEHHGQLDRPGVDEHRPGGPADGRQKFRSFQLRIRGIRSNHKQPSGGKFPSSPQRLQRQAP
jgi:hypothetical protein